MPPAASMTFGNVRQCGVRSLAVRLFRATLTSLVLILIKFAHRAGEAHSILMLKPRSPFSVGA
jgi:hypothetical protein